MKIRHGFVSNSSSSSFLVINKLIGESDKSATIENGTLIVGKNGKREFGWEVERSFDFDSKLNFAYLQLLIIYNHIYDPNYDVGIENRAHWDGIYTKALNLLEKVLIKELKVNNIEYLLKLSYYSEGECPYEGYIDHQSTFYEDGECFEMFKNEAKLRNFLFNIESYVETGNDNG